MRFIKVSLQMEVPFNIAPDQSSQMNHGQSIEEINEIQPVTVNENVEDSGIENVQLEECNAVVEVFNHEIPFVGQQFASEGDAYNAYNAYALIKGFGIRLGKTGLSERTRAVIRRQILCNKEGKKKIRETSADGKVIEIRRREVRTDCKARMNISLNQTTGVWSITTFNDLHNHELTTPSKAGKHRSHKQMHRRASTRRLIDTLHDERLGPSEIATVVNVHSQAQAGGEVDRVTPQICHDQSRKHRRNNISNECVSIVNHFMELMNKDPLFFFALELDEDGTFRSVFWADGRSITTYMEFSDVVVFDLTYRSNKFAMPFAPFTGVNHHRQSTLFGCALIADETEATFVWLFEQWLKCMCGKAPGVIITDQDKAMENAIKKVFPTTRHRFCSWHVDKHVTQHLGDLISTYEGFWNDYQQWFWSESIHESESRWVNLKDMYRLESNDWMMSMYALRRHWVPAYWRDVFTVGMTTSQQSESMNAFFDGFVHAATPLSEFVTQYENALIARRTVEYDEDFRTMDSRPKLDEGLPMEFQAAKCYTRCMYDRFRQEYSSIILYFADEVSDNGDFKEYEVWNSTTTSIKKRLVVYGVNENEVSLSCSCAKFEIEGMLCRHILHIMLRNRLVTIPDKYILKRWTIDARFRGCGFDAQVLGKNITHEVTPLEQFSLRVMQNRLFEVASKSKVVYTDYYKWMEDKLAELGLQSRDVQLSSDRGSNLMPPSTSQNLSEIPEICVHDPGKAFTTKGRPLKPTRICSAIEQSQKNKEKKTITCSHCNLRGHDKTRCPLRKAVNAISFAEGSGNDDPTRNGDFMGD